MGRPRKMENSRSRSFLLPSGLLEQLEEAAKMRGREVSDVVRELLEQSIVAFHRDSIPLWSERLREAVVRVRDDKALAGLFEKHRGRKNLVVPTGLGLKRGQLVRLLEALEADRELAANPQLRQAPAAVDPALEALAAQFPPEAAGRFRGLGGLLESRDIRLARDGEVTRVLVSGRVSAMLRARRRDEPAVEALRQLIEERVLTPDGRHGEQTVWRANPVRSR